MSEFSRLLLNASQIWQLNTLTWAWYHRLHFYIFMLNVIQWSTSSHHVLFFNLHWRKSCYSFVFEVTYFVHFILFVTLLPLWRLLLSSLLHHHLHALLSVWIRLQLLLSLPPCFFSKTKSWLMEEKRLSLCVVRFPFTFCVSQFVILCCLKFKSNAERCD